MRTPLRALLVEDSEDDAQLLLNHLSRAGYDVTWARVDTPECMRAALAEQVWDLVIADHVMPRFSAPAALGVLKESGLDLPFIIMSGAIGEELAVAAMRAGAHDYITKGHLARLVPAIHREMQDAANRRERRQVQELSARFGRLLDSCNDEIYVFDANTLQCLQANQGAYHNLGYSAAELERLTPLELLDPAVSAKEFAALVESLRTGARDQVVFASMHRRRDGSTYPVELRLQLLATESLPALVCIALDITERKRAEEQLRDANAAKDRVLSILSHELRNPMAGIKGLLSLWRRRALAGRPVGDLIESAAVMEREVDRLSALLNEVIEAFRVQSGRLPIKQEPVNLAEVVATALQSFRAAEEQDRFVLEEASGMPAWVQGDFSRLEEVVRNLLSNAVNYSPASGNVRVRLDVEAHRAVLSVRDQGVGIPRDQLTRIFEAFFRGSNLTNLDPGGLGLGLYICREIVERHGGRIWADSDEGCGATFFVELPLSGPVLGAHRNHAAYS